MSQLKTFTIRLARPCSLVSGLLIASAGAQASTVSIINQVFADSNSVVSAACYNGGQSVGPNGLNCNPPGFVWQSSPFATVSGNMDTTGAATNASEKLTINSPTGETAVAYGAGDLSAGTVKSMTSGSAGAEGVSTVSIQDNIHFSIAGAGSATVRPITVDWTFDGALSGPFAGFSGAPVGASSSFQLGGMASASEDIFGGPPTLTGVAQSGWSSFSYTSQTASLVQFTGVYDLVGSSVTAPFLLNLSTFGSNQDTADFSNTSRISLTLPADVTFTSDSGAFLTANSTATPEPATLALLGLGLAGVVVGRRRVKR